MAIELSERIRKEIGLPILWGGPHATICPEDSLQYADYVFRGESERNIVDFADFAGRNKNFVDIAGLWMISDGTTIKNPLRKLEEDLDNLPFPKYESEEILIENGKIQKFNGYRFIMSMTSRGCPFDCSFCSNSYFENIYGRAIKRIRQRSVESVIEELGRAANHLEGKTVIFSDEIFPWQRDWVEHFCSEYSKKIGRPFTICAHPFFCKKEQFSMLKKAGLEYVQIGIQSGSQRILFDIFNRRIPKLSLQKTQKALAEAGVRCYFDLILNNPFDTEETLNETLDFLMTLKKPFMIRTYSLHYLPKTSLTEKCLQEKVISSNDIEGAQERPLNWWVVSGQGRRDFDIYWNAAMRLCGSWLMPNFIIKTVLKKTFFKKHPWYIICLVAVLLFLRKLFLLFREVFLQKGWRKIRIRHLITDFKVIFGPRYE